jgi:hypothetical protein
VLVAKDLYALVKKNRLLKVTATSPLGFGADEK